MLQSYPNIFLNIIISSQIKSRWGWGANLKNSNLTLCNVHIGFHLQFHSRVALILGLMLTGIFPERSHKLIPKYSVSQAELHILWGNYGRQLSSSWSCPGHLPLPHWYHLLLHPQGEAMCQVQQKLLIARLSRSRSWQAGTQLMFAILYN